MSMTKKWYYLRNGTRQRHSYNGRLVGNCLWSVENPNDLESPTNLQSHFSCLKAFESNISYFDKNIAVLLKCVARFVSDSCANNVRECSRPCVLYSPAVGSDRHHHHPHDEGSRLPFQCCGRLPACLWRLDQDAVALDAFRFGQQVAFPE